MASPGFTHHLNDLWCQFARLAALMRAPATVPDKPTVAAPSEAHAVCPQDILRKVGHLVGDDAFSHHVDIMRRYRWDMPLLHVEEVLLVALLTEVVRSAITSAGQGGAVVCSLHYGPEGLRFSISDSSGVTGQHVNWGRDSNRYRILGHLEADAERLGARLLMSVHAGEGVVVEVLFTPSRCLGPATRMSPVMTANQTLIASSAPLEVPLVLTHPV